MARKWWTLAVVCIGVFMLLLDLTIVNVALPDIAGSFNSSLSALQWVIDAYALALASLLLTAGNLADRNGRRLLFLIGVAIFTAGSALCGTATGMAFLALARAFQGIGGALMFATSLALLSESFKGRERGTAFGIFGAMTGLAVATGPVIGGALVTGLGWRWIFLVNIPVGVFVFVLARLRVDESRDPEPKRLDLIGFVTFSTGLFALIFALIRSNHDGWSSPIVIGSLIAAAVLLGSLHRCGTTAARPHVRFQAAARPDLRRRPDRRLRHLGVDLLGAHVPHPVGARAAGILSSAGRRPLSAAVAVHILHGCDRGTAHVLGAHQASHRARVRADRDRAAARCGA